MPHALVATLALAGCATRGYARTPQYGYGPAPQYGYAPPPQYGYGPPPQYGYGPPGQGPSAGGAYAPPLSRPSAPVGSTRGPDPQSPHAGERAAAFAHTMQGRPYCWGGAGPDCFDCSGLTSAAWQAAGLPIPRTSDAQHAQLAPVGMQELAPGDILWRPGHVGIYLGSGWAMHAPGRGKPVQYQPASKDASAHRPR